MATAPRVQMQFWSVMAVAVGIQKLVAVDMDISCHCRRSALVALPCAVALVQIGSINLCST